MDELERLAHQAHKPKPPAGWYPAPHGGPEQHYWTGQVWRSPQEMVEEQIADELRPHLEQMFLWGYKWGVADGQRMAAKEAAENTKVWTFFGHWDNDALVVEYTLEGEHEDPRTDAGHWEQGLFAASGEGQTIEEAERNVRADYETQEA